MKKSQVTKKIPLRTTATTIINSLGKSCEPEYSSSNPQMSKEELEIKLDENASKIQNAKSAEELSQLWDEEDKIRAELDKLSRKRTKP